MYVKYICIYILLLNLHQLSRPLNQGLIKNIREISLLSHSPFVLLILFSFLFFSLDLFFKSLVSSPKRLDPSYLSSVSKDDRKDKSNSSRRRQISRKLNGSSLFIFFFLSFFFFSFIFFFFQVGACQPSESCNFQQKQLLIIQQFSSLTVPH